MKALALIINKVVRVQDNDNDAKQLEQIVWNYLLTNGGGVCGKQKQLKLD